MSIFKSELELIVNEVEEMLKVNKFLGAEKKLIAAINKYEQPANLINLLGVVYHKQSKFMEAIREFRKAKHINPVYIEASLNLSITYCDLGLYEKAQEVYLSINKSDLTKNPDRNPIINGRAANMHAASGEMYSKLGLHDKAVKEFKKAIELYNKMPEVHISLTKSLIALKKFEEALTLLEKDSREFPKNAKFYLYQGILHYKLGNNDRAKLNWKKANHCDPYNSSAKIYLKLSQNWGASNKDKPPLLND